MPVRSRNNEPTGTFLPRAPIFTPGYFCSFSNGSGGQSADALVEPQAEAFGSPHLPNGSWSVFFIVLPVATFGVPLPQARLIHEAEILPAVLTRDFVELAVVGLAIVILVSEIAGRRRRSSFIRTV